MADPNSIYPLRDEDAPEEASSACRIWLGCTDKDGYGVSCRDGKQQRAHRLAYCDARSLEIEDIEGLNVCHTCDTPGCVKSSHLFLGTQKSNMQDCAEKGRSTRLLGEDNGRAKLTEAHVYEIRRRYFSEIVTQRQLASDFGVSLTQIHRIITNKNRTHG